MCRLGRHSGTRTGMLKMRLTRCYTGGTLLLGGPTRADDDLESVVREDIPRLAKDVRKQSRMAIEQKLTSHPMEFGNPLRYSLKGGQRLRVEDWRVIYTIEPPSVVLIVKIGHRKDVCEP